MRGYVALGSLGDFVWFDENKNGIQDPEETGVKDVIVNLYTVTNGEVSGTPEKLLELMKMVTIYLLI